MQRNIKTNDYMSSSFMLHRTRHLRLQGICLLTDQTDLEFLTQYQMSAQTQYNCLGQ